MIDFGKFQQSRIAHNTFMPQHVRPSKSGEMPPILGGERTITEINIDRRITTGSSFLDFLGGFMMGCAPFLGTKKSTQISTINQSQQTQITQQPSNNNQLANLKALFGAKFEIVQDSDGRFSATSKSTGELVANNDSYEDTKAKLGGANTKQKTEPQGTPKPETPSTQQADPKPDPKTDNKYGTPASAKDINGYKGAFTVHDGGASRVNGDIKRDTSSVEGGSEKDFPTKIKVGKFEYKFERMDGNHAIYSSVSGRKNKEEYRLEKNSDGTFALNQYEGDNGFNEVDITAKRQKEIEGG